MGERMTPAPIDPETVGQRVAELLDGAPSSATRLAQRQRLVHSVEGGHRRPRWGTWRWMSAGVMAAAAAVLLVLVWSPWNDAAPTMAMEAETPAPAPSRWFAAPIDGAIDVDVGDGSRMQLVDGARGRMTADDPERAMLALENGLLQAEVEPRAGRRWTIEAGPYRVRVVGTIFDVDWDPAAGELEVTVTRGKVEVSGPHGSSPIPVDAGQRLKANLPGATATLDAIEAAQDEHVQEAIEPEAATPARARRRSTADAPPSWASLARAGEYAEAFAAAEAIGLERLIGSGGRGELELLGDTARLAKRPGDAIAIYEAIVERFAHSAAASRAAFQLGRLHADHRNNPRAASRWFRTYLEERPEGPLAPQARGRLIQTLLAAGDRQGARAAAREYLDRHPKGAHAKLARSLIPP